jgi:DNA polymerase-3 subunit epsilon
MAICFIDTETTGLDKSRHEIIEIAIIVWNGCKLTIYNKKIMPMNIASADPVALKINGYTASGWADAPTFAEEAQNIADRICGHVVVGHNVQFDIGFIEKQLKSAGVAVPRIRTVDTCTLVHEHLIPIGCPGHGLDKVRAYLGWVRPNAHTAYVDAMDCYRLYKLLVRASVWQRFKIWAMHKMRPYLPYLKMPWGPK